MNLSENGWGSPHSSQPPPSEYPLSRLSDSLLETNMVVVNFLLFSVVVVVVGLLLFFLSIFSLLFCFCSAIPCQDMFSSSMFAR